MRPLLAVLQARFLAQGGALEFETKAEKLVQDARGEIAGVQALARAGIVDHAAHAVVIATGGYTANRELLTTFVHPDAANMVFRGVSWATGDGLLMAKACGAGLTRTAGVASLHIAAVSPDDPTHGIPDHAVPYCVALNVHGKRFHDEAEGYVANGKAALAQPGQRIALVFDEEIRKQQRVTISVDTFRRLKLPVLEAATIQELAAKMGIDGAAVAATIDEYNAAVDGARTTGLHPPKSALAAKISVPKFYAFFPLVPGVTSTFGGLMIGSDAQVLAPDGTPLRGLYAAGEGAGGLFDSDYIGGSSLANCLVMGRIAGRSAADRAREMTGKPGLQTRRP
jgi:succinate dehydrogenase/fumarate reductase flavoprotein subunit